MLRPRLKKTQLLLSLTLPRQLRCLVSYAVMAQQMILFQLFERIHEECV